MAGTKHWGRLAAIAMTMTLGACQGSLVSGSPEGVPVAVESIDGAPAPVQTALLGELTNAASDRKVELVGTGAQARYRVRGYLSTTTEEGETKVSYVWDVFDAQKRRAKRLESSRAVTLASGSISAIDKGTLAKLAQSSMDEIAEFLSNSKSVQTAEVTDDDSSVALQ
ncbi:hypothetical protein MHY87_03065 [Microvirga sp. ACRRW]|uniref:hypothetical protein n=1 Tax=Microvirga sp. ACRRW TaxID=2918205 RepID=UPI001EF49B89|nr:hypothetical protein [Microvirga sp. ACRRW]MCG7391884.1 hypothetical protein [Microvirga sp. ACRRW]